MSQQFNSIVLIPGLWMTFLSWENWIKRYTDYGYRVIAKSWPGMDGDIEELRRDPSPIATLGIAEIVAHYEQIIRSLDSPPLIAGLGQLASRLPQPRSKVSFSCLYRQSKCRFRH